MSGETMIVRAGTLIDGSGAEPQREVALTVERGVVTQIGPWEIAPRDLPQLDLSEFYVLPGLINMHAHTILPGDGTPFVEWMALPDELLLLQAHANALAALHSGVTTIRDCGGKGRLMFRLRDAIRAGIVGGPRFVLSGRPLTITGGHCRYFGGEVDGAEAMRHAARQLLAEGADFIKIMAAGGGTIGTYAQYPAFDLDELTAGIREAHKIGKLASCHCIATESISLALDAGVDHIEHCSFMAPDRLWRYDETLARRVAEAGVYVTPTLQVGADSMVKMKERHAQGIATPEEAQIVVETPDRNADTVANARYLHEAGVRLVAGNDAGWRYTRFDTLYRELQLLVDAGLTPLDAISAATSRAAAACQLAHQIGTLAPGRIADLIAVRQDPTSDVAALDLPSLVVQGGRTVVDRR